MHSDGVTYTVINWRPLLKFIWATTKLNPIKWLLHVFTVTVASGGVIWSVNTFLFDQIHQEQLYGQQVQDGMIGYVRDDVEELREDVEKLSSLYHHLDKQFAIQLSQLEFKGSDPGLIDKVRSDLQTRLDEIATQVADMAYILSLSKINEETKIPFIPDRYKSLVLLDKPLRIESSLIRMVSPN